MELLEQLSVCVERGKINAAAPYPPDLKGQPGADELTKQALDEGVAPGAILKEALMAGMHRIGTKFSKNEAFVPDLLMAAKAMTVSMEHLKPFFESGEAEHVGTFVVGTVKGDLHDIGKNLVSMVMEGGGYKVVDLGVDVPTERFVQAVEEHPGCVVGLSALLTTTMVNMEETVRAIKEKSPDTIVLVGGAPLNQDFCDKIGADGYAPDPQTALDVLESRQS